MSGAAKHKQNQINKNAWWAREDSNHQPSGYERATFTAITSKYWHFRSRSSTNVRVWLRRFIGYPLVGREAGFASANPNGLRFSPQLTKQCSQVLPPEPIHKNVANRFARQKIPDAKHARTACSTTASARRGLGGSIRPVCLCKNT